MTNETLLTPDVVAKRLGVPLKTLYYWRTMGVGPPAYRIGRHLRYRDVDVETWLAERRSPQARPAVEARVATGGTPGRRRGPPDV
jgi:excisionase family DNA binding protein